MAHAVVPSSTHQGHLCAPDVSDRSSGSYDRAAAPCSRVISAPSVPRQPEQQVLLQQRVRQRLLPVLHQPWALPSCVPSSSSCGLPSLQVPEQLRLRLQVQQLRRPQVQQQQRQARHQQQSRAPKWRAWRVRGQRSAQQFSLVSSFMSSLFEVECAVTIAGGAHCNARGPGSVNYNGISKVAVYA